MGKTQNKKNKVDLKSIDLKGNIPPHNIEIEKIVLGATLLEPESIYKIIDLIEPDSFYLDAHQKIYKAIIELNQNLAPIDYITVGNKLKAQDLLDEIGGLNYLATLTTNVATSAHIIYHSKIVQQKYIQRELIKAGIKITEDSFDDEKDVDNLINDAEANIFNISNKTIKKDIKSLADILPETLNLLEKRMEEKQEISGVPCGLVEIDRVTYGFQKSDLIIVAARPSMGKTAFALTLARNMAVNHGKGVAFFSLEMSQQQLTTRLLTIETDIKANAFRTGKFNERENEWARVKTAIESLSKAPIFIDDTPAISVYELRAKIRRLIRENKNQTIDCVIIDYLQLMTAGLDKGNREQEISTISRTLKAIAKELDVPIIALSQLNRAVETRTVKGVEDKKPQLSDLRESGAIEQDADLVMFVHRPEYYKIMTIKYDGGEVDEITQKPKHSEINSEGVAMIIVAKHRNGEVGDHYMYFNKSTTKFKNIESEDAHSVLLRSRKPFSKVVPSESSVQVIESAVNSRNNNEDAYGAFEKEAGEFM